MSPDGGSAIPVVVVMDTTIEGGPAIPIWGFANPPEDGRPVIGQPARRVVLISDTDLIQNGGKFWLDGRVSALPTASIVGGIDEGNIPIAVYLVGSGHP